MIQERDNMKTNYQIYLIIYGNIDAFKKMEKLIITFVTQMTEDSDLHIHQRGSQRTKQR